MAKARALPGQHVTYISPCQSHAAVLQVTIMQQEVAELLDGKVPVELWLTCRSAAFWEFLRESCIALHSRVISSCGQWLRSAMRTKILRFSCSKTTWCMCVRPADGVDWTLAGWAGRRVRHGLIRGEGVANYSTDHIITKRLRENGRAIYRSAVCSVWLVVAEVVLWSYRGHARRREKFRWCRLIPGERRRGKRITARQMQSWTLAGATTN